MIQHTNIIPDIEKQQKLFFEKFKHVAGITKGIQLLEIAQRYNEDPQTKAISINDKNPNNPIDPMRITNEFLFYMMDYYKVELVFIRPSVQFGTLENFNSNLVLKFSGKKFTRAQIAQVMENKPEEYKRLMIASYVNLSTRYLKQLKEEYALTNIAEYKLRYATIVMRIFRAVSVSLDIININNMLRSYGVPEVNFDKFIDRSNGKLREPKSLATPKIFIRPIVVFDIGYKWVRLSDLKKEREGRLETFTNKVKITAAKLSA